MNTSISTAPRRSVWPWLLLAVLGACVLATVAAGWGLAHWADAFGDGASVTIDGETWRIGGLAGVGGLAWWSVAAVLVCTVVIVAVVVPLAVAGALLAALAAVGVALALVVIVVAAGLALLASPFVLLGALVWRATASPRAA